MRRAAAGNKQDVRHRSGALLQRSRQLIGKQSAKAVTKEGKWSGEQPGDRLREPLRQGTDRVDCRLSKPCAAPWIVRDPQFHTFGKLQMPLAERSRTTSCVREQEQSHPSPWTILQADEPRVCFGGITAIHRYA